MTDNIHITCKPIALDIKIGRSLVLSNVNVSMDEALNFDPCMPTILVAGSALEFLGDQRGLAPADYLQECCLLLAQMLGRLKVNLINGACPGLPNDVLLHFNKQPGRGVSIGLSAYASREEHTSCKSFAEAGFPVHADLTIFSGAGFEYLNVITSTYCDAVVIVGGGLGTLLEAGAAVEQETPVFCILTSGGMASRLDSVMHDFIAGFKSYSLRTFDELSDLERAIADLGREMRQLTKISKLTPIILRIQEAQQDQSRNVIIEIGSNLEQVTYTSGTDYFCASSPICLIDWMRIAREYPGGDALVHALRYHGRIYRYDGIEMAFSQAKDLVIWGPSIDTLWTEPFG